MHLLRLYAVVKIQGKLELPLITFKNASAILPEAISAGGLTLTTDTSLFYITYRGGSHLPSDTKKTCKAMLYRF